MELYRGWSLWTMPASYREAWRRVVEALRRPRVTRTSNPLSGARVRISEAGILSVGRTAPETGRNPTHIDVGNS